MSRPVKRQRSPEVLKGSMGAEVLYPIVAYHVECKCPSCRLGRLYATGEQDDAGLHLHQCDGANSCGAVYAIEGRQYPMRREVVSEINVSGAQFRPPLLDKPRSGDFPGNSSPTRT